MTGWSDAAVVDSRRIPTLSPHTAVGTAVTLRAMRRLPLVIATAALAVPALAAAADPVDGRLHGEFRMKGVITRAEKVKGEEEGDKVTRNWIFRSDCESGPCDEVLLRRHRGEKRVDRLTLERKEPGKYSGKGKFRFPIRCAGRVYEKGGEARFRIDLTITAADAEGIATDVKAKYTNPRRINHTQCGDDDDLGRDGARYTGRLKDAGGDTGGSGSEPGPDAGTGTTDPDSGGASPPPRAA